MASNPAQELIKFGTSVWYDNISRSLIQSGELARLIETSGVRGLTSNPSIFDNALKQGGAYSDSLARLKQQGVSSERAFEEIAIEDIAMAADLLRPVFIESRGIDGFVSIEVSPLLASDTQGTVEEAVRLYKRLDRPNVMIKVPGTPEGIPAVRALLEQGINVNITLLFSVENYVEVATTYCQALRARAARNEPIDSIRSVASFFVSRVDTNVDAKLEKIAASKPDLADEALGLRGQFGVANSKIAYQRFLEIFGDDFEDLRKLGAAVQRPLWASTSTKNPNYRDVIYIEELIGPDTVNTVPHDTLAAFVDHGQVAVTLTKDLDRALELPAKLTALGVDLGQVFDELQTEGVQKFSDAFYALNETLKQQL